VGGGFVNPLKAYDRVGLAAAGFILLAAAALNRADLMGLGLVLGGLVWAWQWFKRRGHVSVPVGESAGIGTIEEHLTPRKSRKS
jgi:hypothetical protein